MSNRSASQRYLLTQNEDNYVTKCVAKMHEKFWLHAVVYYLVGNILTSIYKIIITIIIIIIIIIIMNILIFAHLKFATCLQNIWVKNQYNQ